MKIHYVGIPTSLEFQKEMIRLVPFAYKEYPNIYSHHITLLFAPSDEQIEEISFGNMYEYTANNIYQTNDLVVAAIQSIKMETDFVSQRRLHVTLATSKGISPVKSNEVLAGNSGCYTMHLGSDKTFSGRVCGFSSDGKIVRER